MQSNFNYLFTIKKFIIYIVQYLSHNLIITKDQ